MLGAFRSLSLNPKPLNARIAFGFGGLLVL